MAPRGVLDPWFASCSSSFKTLASLIVGSSVQGRSSDGSVVGGILSLVLETIDFVSRTTFVSRKGEEREPAKGGKRASVSLLQFSSNDESLRYFVIFDGNKFGKIIVYKRILLQINVSLVCMKIYVNRVNWKFKIIRLLIICHRIHDEIKILLNIKYYNFK